MSVSENAGETIGGNQPVAPAPVNDAQLPLAGTAGPLASKPRGRGLVWLWILMVAAAAGAGFYFGNQFHQDRLNVATVNGENVSKEYFFRRMDALIGKQTIREIVSEQIQIQYAKARKAMPPDSEVKAAVSASMKDPNFQREVQQSGDEPDEFLNQYTRQVQVNLAKVAVLTQGINVTEDEIKKFYERNTDKDNPTARFYTPQSTTIQVIRNSSEPAIEAASSELARGVDFGAVVAKFSQDPSASKQGLLTDLYYGRNTMRHIPGMENAIFSIKIGDVYGPHQFANSWWIIKCVDKAPPSTVPYDRAHLEATYGAKVAKVTPKRMQAIQSDFSSFQHDSHIDTTWPEFQSALKLAQ